MYVVQYSYMYNVRGSIQLHVVQYSYMYMYNLRGSIQLHVHVHVQCTWFNTAVLIIDIIT